MKVWVYIAGVGVVAAAGPRLTSGRADRRKPSSKSNGRWSASTAWNATTTQNSRESCRSKADTSTTCTRIPAVWEKVVHKLSIGAMPPRDQPQPDTETRAKFLAALMGTLDAAAEENPYAGAKTVHRLNRAEYANAVRDLLGVEADLAELLPSDGGDFGFDNIAQVLTTSPFLLERYLTVALRVADMAVGNPKRPDGQVVSNTLRAHPGQASRRLATRDARRHESRHTFPADGEYVLSGRLFAASRKVSSASRGTTGRTSS